jgi:2-polyprenyl-3-methyl-5-hydroxy-6-metoxy-1,4-benzoquinol methylase
VNDTADEAIIARIAARYRLHPHRSYARGKLRWDPVFDAAATLFSDSSRALLDIGCGLGLLGQYLRERGFRAPYRGLDLDARKIDAARAAARNGADLEFEIGSATALPAFAGDVVLIDVLHYLQSNAQQRVIAAAAERVAPGGILMIRNVLREPGWRFRTTLIEERLARMLGWMRCPTGYFPRREDIEIPLRELEFAVQVAPLWGKTPFNSYLFVARRAADRG